MNIVVTKGGQGSGFHGHAGRPGEVGGSALGPSVGHGEPGAVSAKYGFMVTIRDTDDIGPKRPTKRLMETIESAASRHPAHAMRSIGQVQIGSAYTGRADYDEKTHSIRMRKWDIESFDHEVGHHLLWSGNEKSGEIAGEFFNRYRNENGYHPDFGKLTEYGHTSVFEGFAESYKLYMKYGGWSEDENESNTFELIDRFLKVYNQRGVIVTKGGAGSGHHGHRGRPGEVGGSAPTGISNFPHELFAVMPEEHEVKYGVESTHFTQNSWGQDEEGYSINPIDNAAKEIANEAGINGMDMLAVRRASLFQSLYLTYAGTHVVESVSREFDIRPEIDEKALLEQYGKKPVWAKNKKWVRDDYKANNWSEADRPLKDAEMDKLTRAVYNYTQKSLKKAGITSLRVYRGSDTGAHSNILSSWTLDPDVAKGFGNVESRIVPAKSVWSIPVTGFGVPSQLEVLLLNSGDVPHLKSVVIVKGGAGSGHHGHSGRPGEVGGSVPGQGGQSYHNMMSADWLNQRLGLAIYQQEVGNRGIYVYEDTNGIIRLRTYEYGVGNTQSEHYNSLSDAYKAGRIFLGEAQPSPTRITIKRPVTPSVTTATGHESKLLIGLNGGPEAGNAFYAQFGTELDDFLEDAYIQDLGNGIHTTINISGCTIYKSNGVPYMIHLNGEIHDSINDPNGLGKIGYFTRDIDMTNKSIDHTHFELNMSYQNQGIGMDFYRTSEQSYSDAGFETIKLYADMSVGGYAWARMGYDFDNTQYDRRSEDLSSVRRKMQDNWYNRYHVDAPKRYMSMTHTWEFATVKGPDGHNIGKEVMRASAWYGVKSLNPRSKGYKIGQAYYAARDKSRP